ncbi:MAG: zinc ABC transporter substrate-binding protein [Methanoregula sp.]|jgi:zinc transport system substrate-binding protein|uniref:metal ABC transporter solute-binding protein, Zn/Mn family n=1 Tax=Methanoregula sp. TaxID=2052170 RepID=UPI003C281F98
MIPSSKKFALVSASAIVIILVVLIALPYFTQSGTPHAPSVAAGSTGKLQVITSFRPITLLVEPVAGDYADVTQLLPPGAEPHEYEPTPGDAMTLAKGKVLFYDGPFMEPWVENIAGSANPDIVRAPFIDSIPPSALAQMKIEYPDFPNTDQDPHLWLSPQLAGYYVPYIANQLSAADPANASGYQKNAAAFETRLEKLDADYSVGLKNCTTRTFLTSHAFLDYQAAAYNLTALSISGLSPDAEPSVQQMASILKEAKADNVRGVLAETDEVQALSQSIATELNLPVYPYSTMEVLPAGPLNSGDNDYVSIMENNLQQMRQALKCQ